MQAVKLGFAYDALESPRLVDGKEQDHVLAFHERISQDTPVVDLCRPDTLVQSVPGA